MNISFVLQVASHARYWRRINNLEKLGVNTKVFAFDREFYQGNIDQNDYISLGEVEKENYLKRIPRLFKSISTLRKYSKDADIYYTFGIDTFFISWLSTLLRKNKKIIYEVGDIRSILVKDNFAGKLFRFIEKILLKRADLVVVTSEAFIDGYFKGILGMDDVKYHVIENKPELEFEKVKEVSSKDEKLKNGDKITIGYFGVLRDRRTLEILIKLARDFSESYNIYLRGISNATEDLINEISKYPNVTVGGEYTVPQDLYSMYSKIDIIWAAYPYQGEQIGNWKWARTTRFYEACFFEKPMITQKGTQDGKFVENYNIGVEIDFSNLDTAVNQLRNITISNINEMKSNYSNVPENVYKYDNEHVKLIEILEE